MASKATGIVRATDHLGRIVLPKGLRKRLKLEAGTPMEVFLQGDKIILKKQQAQCTVCNTITTSLYGPSLCKACIVQLHTLVTNETSEPN